MGFASPLLPRSADRGGEAAHETKADGSTGRVVGLDPPSRKLTLLTRFGTFVSSPNERWIVGQERSSNPFGAHMVAVISLATHTCRVVATTKGPDRYLSVDKSP